MPHTVANSELLTAITRLVRTGIDDHRESATVLLGVIMRNATLVGEAVDMCEMVTSLVDVLRDQFRNTQLKRRLIASLGESIFYIASQAASSSDPLPPQWNIPDAVYAMLRRCMREGGRDDSIVCHYAIKTIENVAYIDGLHAEVITTKEMGLLIWTVFSKQKESQIRKSCGWAISRLTERSSAVFQHIVDKAGVVAVMDALRDPNMRVRQTFLNALLHVFGANGGLTRLKTTIVESPDFLQRIMAALEGASSAHLVRGKCYLLLALISDINHDLLVQALQGRVFHFLERDLQRRNELEKNGDAYVADCAEQLVEMIIKIVPRLLEPLNDILVAVSGRKRPSAAQAKSLRAYANTYPAVLSVVQASLTHDRICDSIEFYRLIGSIVYQLGPFIEDPTTSKDSSLDELIRTSISIVEIISHNAPSHSAAWNGLYQELLPVVSDLLGAAVPDVRLSALHIVSNIINTLAAHLADSRNESTGETGVQPEDSKRMLAEFFSTHLLKRCQALLVDENHPIPVYTIKLLCRLVEDVGDAMVAIFFRTSLCELIVKSLQRQSKEEPKDVSALQIPLTGLDSEHTVMLIQQLVHSQHYTPYALCEHGLAWRAARALSATVHAGDAALPLLAPLLQVSCLFVSLQCTLLFVPLVLSCRCAVFF